MTLLATDLSPQQRQALIDALSIEAARRSFDEYCRYVHNIELYPHLKAWYAELKRADIKRKAIVAPPESWKSTLIRYLLEWEIGQDTNERVIWVMNTATQAMRNIMAMKATIQENDRFHAVFPNVRLDPKKPQTQDTIYLVREESDHPDPTVFGTGWNGAYQGMHPKKIVADDLTNQDEVRSETVMSDQRARLRGVLLDRLTAGGEFWAIFTRWGEADLFQDFKDMGFSMLEQPVEGRYPWGRLLSTDLFPDDRLLDLRTQKGSALYALTYLCDPGAATGSMVKREWWQWYSEDQEIPRGKRVHSWDLSTGISAQGDFSAFGHWGATDYGYYALDGGRWRLTMDELVKKMTSLYVEQRPQIILVEEAGTSIPVIQYLRSHTNLPIRSVKPGTKDKVSRVQAVIGLIESKRVWLPSGKPWTSEFVDELARFPGGRYDDQVDQMAQALEYLEQRGIASTARGEGGGAWKR